MYARPATIHTTDSDEVKAQKRNYNLQLSQFLQQRRLGNEQAAQAKASAEAAATASKHFLDMWKEGYDKNIAYQDEMMDLVRDQNTTRYDELATQLDTVRTRYEQTLGALPDQFADQAQTELGLRNTALAGLGQSSIADYEGVRGAAMADVQSQYDTAQKDKTRKLYELGLDPENVMARSSDSMGLALGKVGAARQAKREEQNRVAGVQSQLAQLANPTGMTAAAQGIYGGMADLGSMAGNIESAKTSSQQMPISNTGNMVGMQSGTIGQPLNIAGTYAGMMGGATNFPVTSPSSSTSSGGSTNAPQYATSGLSNASANAPRYASANG